MKRAALERHRAARIAHAHIALVHDGDPGNCDCETQVGRFRKGQRIAGCGRARCLVCHYSKILGFPTRKEMMAEATFREMIEEVGCNRHPK